MRKWERYCILREDERIQPFLPETHLLTEENLLSLLDTKDEVILKPVSGSGGSGVIIVSLEGNNRILVQEKLSKHTTTKSDLFSFLADYILKEFTPYIDRGEITTILAKSYMVQHRISLATVDQCPFDIRVMVQRKAELPWKITGTLAKIASTGYAITNVNLGATLVPVEDAIQRSSLNKFPQHELLSQLEIVALLSVERLQRHFPILQMIGFDLCFDTEGKAWMIEANFKPDDYIFLELEDKTMYQTIREYSEGSK